MRMTMMIAIAAMVAAAAHPATAQDPASVDIQAAPSTTPFSTPTLGEADLQAVAGREDTTQIARNEQVAGVSQNSVGDNAVTGEVRIDGSAFQNMSGLSILNVNTGNNVAINAAMNVNISISPSQ